MRNAFVWAEWDLLRRLILPLFALQIAVLGFFGVDGVERFLLSREPVLLELRDGHVAADAQEFLIFLRHFSPVSRAIYRTREQQFLVMQSVFPATRFSESRATSFRDVLVVHVRASQGYRSLLGAVMVEPRWQELITFSALVRMGEQVQKVQSVGTVLRFLRVGFLGIMFILSCAIFLSLLHRARRAFSRDEENGTLQECLGTPFLSIIEPVAYRFAIVVSVGTFLSFFVVSLAVKLIQVDTMAILTVFLVEGVSAVCLSVGATILSRYVLCIPLRLAHSSDH